MFRHLLFPPSQNGDCICVRFAALAGIPVASPLQAKWFDLPESASLGLGSGAIAGEGMKAGPALQLITTLPMRKGAQASTNLTAALALVSPAVPLWKPSAQARIQNNLGEHAHGAAFASIAPCPESSPFSSPF